MCEFYPEEMIRGISCPDARDEYGGVTSSAFQPFIDEREDEYSELSICWHDEADVWSVLKTQLNSRTNDFQFKKGFAILSKSEIDRQRARNLRVENDEYWKYERAPIDGQNKYHGNILVKKNIDRRKRVQLLQQLCLAFVRFVEFEDA